MHTAYVFGGDCYDAHSDHAIKSLRKFLRKVCSPLVLRCVPLVCTADVRFEKYKSPVIVEFKAGV
jgi:hypothetical protein